MPARANRCKPTGHLRTNHRPRRYVAETVEPQQVYVLSLLIKGFGIRERFNALQVKQTLERTIDLGVQYIFNFKILH